MFIELSCLISIVGRNKATSFLHAVKVSEVEFYKHLAPPEPCVTMLRLVSITQFSNWKRGITALAHPGAARDC